LIVTLSSSLLCFSQLSYCLQWSDSDLLRYRHKRVRLGGADAEESEANNYWRVVIVYTDEETSGNRVFSNLDPAKRWAARQEKSTVVKEVSDRTVRARAVPLPGITFV
jgi:hypothetical protein